MKISFIIALLLIGLGQIFMSLIESTDYLVNKTKLIFGIILIILAIILIL